jgi:hypothetical protein
MNNPNAEITEMSALVADFSALAGKNYDRFVKTNYNYCVKMYQIKRYAPEGACVREKTK